MQMHCNLVPELAAHQCVSSYLSSVCTDRVSSLKAFLSCLTPPVSRLQQSVALCKRTDWCVPYQSTSYIFAFAAFDQVNDLTAHADIGIMTLQAWRY